MQSACKNEVDDGPSVIFPPAKRGLVSRIVMITQESSRKAGDKGLWLPSHALCDTTMLLNVTEEACKRLHLSIQRAEVVLSRGWRWDAVSARHVSTVLSDFYLLQDLLIEAQRVVALRISRGEERTSLHAINAVLVCEEKELVRDITAYLSMVERPVEVLRQLFQRGNRRFGPEMISALLGIQDESIGGDILRHPSSERGARFGQGGFMYQPSEPHELWQVFNLLKIKPDSLFVDVGSGYGHVLFFGAIARPDVRFRGIELMSARVEECEAVRARHGMSNISFVAGDVTQGGFSDADIIFLFNPFPPDTKGLVVEEIGRIAQKKPLVVVDYQGLVTQSVSNIVPVTVRDLAPYRLVCSQKYLQESCDLIGISAPEVALRKRSR